MPEVFGPTRRLATAIREIQNLDSVQAQVELYLEPDVVEDARELTKKVRAYATEQAQQYAHERKQELIGQLVELQRESNKEIADLLGQVEKQQPTLPQRVLAMCKHRNWSLHWTARGVYLHLEASELIESLRGKRGDPKLEAADVVIVLMSIIEEQGIAWDDVLQAASDTVDRLMAAPPYEGEERMQTTFVDGGIEQVVGDHYKQRAVDALDARSVKSHDAGKLQRMYDEAVAILDIASPHASGTWGLQYSHYIAKPWKTEQLPEALEQAWKLMAFIDCTMSNRFWDTREAWRKKFFAEFGPEKRAAKLAGHDPDPPCQADHEEMLDRRVRSVKEAEKAGEEFNTLADKIDRGNWH